MKGRKEASRTNGVCREGTPCYVGDTMCADNLNMYRRMQVARKLQLAVLLLILFTAVLGSTKAEAQANHQPDAPGGPIDYLLVLTRDGVVHVSLNGDKQLLIPNVGASYSLEVQDEKIYVSNQTYGGAILEYNLQGDLLRTIPIPPQANRYLNFVVLSGDRFALMDNNNDKIFITNVSGQLLATINIRDTPDIEAQCLDGLVVSNRLIFAEDGDQHIFQVDLATYQKSLFKDMNGVDGHGICSLAYSDGRYYSTKLKYPNNKLYAFTETGPPNLIADIPGMNTVGIAVTGNTAYAGVNFSGTIYAVNVVNGSSTVVATGLNYPKDLEGVHTAQTYSVSGRVLDTQGTPIPNVLISDGVGHSATTNSSGNYSLTGLNLGTYTITPSRSGYIFCPRNRQVSVSSNVVGQNFTGSLAGTDLGFCPEPNGFGFANQQLLRSWAMFEQFYTSAQVRHPDGSICAGAQLYFDQTYRNVANGWSCFGFALSSLHSFQSRPQPNAGPFAIAPFGRLYDQPQSQALTDPIAYYSGTQLSQQFFDQYRDEWLATCDADPDQMTTRLQQALQAGTPLLLGLNAGSVYHAVAPYRVVTVSSNETHIYVYDSEAPGQQRVVRMQRSGSGWQWQYTFIGSLSSAGTRTGGCRDMYYYQAATSLEHGTPLTNMCGEGGIAVPDGSTSAPVSSDRMLSVLPATGDWIIEDMSGNRLGWTGGQWIAEIPNGYALPQTFGDATLSYRSLYLPADSYTIRANAGSSRTVDYSLFADGRVLQVNGRTFAAGVTSVIGVSPGLDAISVTQPADLASVAIDLVHELPTASRLAGLSVSTTSGNDELIVTFDGQAMKLSRAAGTLQYRLRLLQPGRNPGYFVTEPVTLSTDEAHILTPTNWNGLNNATAILEIDEGRNGTIDETMTLENTSRSIFLPFIPGG